ncbi:MAG: GMC family oxidoreductase [Myxococcota bacterium]
MNDASLPTAGAQTTDALLRDKTKTSYAGRIVEFGEYDGPVRITTDYLVIGSGPGGAMAAWSLADQGETVTVVEAGPRLRVKDFGLSMGHTLASYFWDGGTRSVRGNVFFPTMQVRGLGGGTLYNSSICMRPTESALENWRDEHGLVEMTSTMLAPHFEAVETFLSIRPTQASVFGRRNALFKEACEKLGWAWSPIKRAEMGCVGSGNCITGCESGAKLSLDKRGMPEVAEAGGQVLTSVQIDKLIIEHGRVRGAEGYVVDPKTHQRKHPVRILAGCTIVAAGAIGTPTILRRSGLTREAIGNQLRFHPSCYMVGVTDEVVNPWFGATQGVHSTEHLDKGIKLESLWAGAGGFSRGFPTKPRTFARHISRWPKMTVFDGWVSGDSSVGRVRVLPGGRPDLEYTLGAADARRLQETHALLCEMFDAVGAKEVIPGLQKLPDTMSPAEAASRIREAILEPTDMPTASNHVFGGMAMGHSEQRAATDGWGRVYDVDDLYVSDTSLYPSSPGVNPQLTTMALGHRLGQELTDRY